MIYGRKYFYVFIVLLTFNFIVGLWAAESNFLNSQDQEIITRSTNIDIVAPSLSNTLIREPLLIIAGLTEILIRSIILTTIFGVSRILFCTLEISKMTRNNISSILNFQNILKDDTGKYSELFKFGVRFISDIEMFSSQIVYSVFLYVVLMLRNIFVTLKTSKSIFHP